MMQRLNDAEPKVAGIEALNKAPGAADGSRFMNNETTDYVEISRCLYDGQSIDDIFARSKTQWEG